MRKYRLTYHYDVEIQSPEEYGVETWEELERGLRAIGELNNGWEIQEEGGDRVAEGVFAGLEVVGEGEER